MSCGSSRRPVPRRESPWGTPEGDHRQPKAHKCNDRAKDVIQMRALKVTHLRQFQVLSSSSGNACAQNLERRTNGTILLFAIGPTNKRSEA
ncbi:unnamed protein product [Camellia sinensis]